MPAYSIAVDFPNGFRRRNLILEVAEDAGLSARTLSSLDVNGDVVTLTFDQALSGAEQTALDAVVAAHDPYPDDGLEFVPGGSRYLYQKMIFPIAFEVQYAKLALPRRTWRGVRIWLRSGGVSGALVRVGLYSHDKKKPKTKLASGSRVLVAGDDLKDVDVLFTTPVVAEDAKWIAVSVDSATPKFAGSDALHAKFHKIKFEATVDGVLPATANSGNGSGAIVFAALLEA